VTDACVRTFSKHGRSRLTDQTSGLKESPPASRLPMGEEQGRAMSEQDNRNDGSLVPAGRRDLAPVGGANPLVSRAIADLAQYRFPNAPQVPSLQPQDPAFYYNRGLGRLDEFDYEKAIEDFTEAIRLNPRNAIYYNARALAWLCRDPRNAQYCSHDLARLDEESYSKAFTDLDNAIQIDPQNSALLNSRALGWLDKEDYIKAIRDLDESIRLEPQHAHYYFNRGMAWLGVKVDIESAWTWSDGDLQKVINKEINIKQAAWLDPIFPYDKVLHDIEQAYADQDFEKGGQLLGTVPPDPNDKAIKDFDQAILLDPNCAPAYYERGRIRPDKDGAIQDFDQAIRLNPDNAVYYLRRGEIWSSAYYKKRDYDKAIEDFDQAIRLGARFARGPLSDAHRERASTWFKKGGYDKAINDLDEAIGLQPWNSFLYHDRGRAWARKKCYDQAIKDFDEAIRRCPKAAGFYYLDRADAWTDKKNYAKAFQDYEEAIRLLPPALTYAYERLAWLLATCPDPGLRDGKRAIQLATHACERTQWQKSLELDTLAAAYAEAGQFEEAVRCQVRALECYQGPAGDGFRERLELYRGKKPFREGR